MPREANAGQMQSPPGYQKIVSGLPPSFDAAFKIGSIHGEENVSLILGKPAKRRKLRQFKANMEELNRR